ncbi:IS5 family transposase [Streptomyces californicus]|uniref:IS5 family transposase n=1 Tax=Streptomyces californicus TaxID=67351 RepID=UPI00399072BE
MDLPFQGLLVPALPEFNGLGRGAPGDQERCAYLYGLPLGHLLLRVVPRAVRPCDVAPHKQGLGAGVWQQLHEVLLAELNAAARLDWSQAVVDSPRQSAKRGLQTGPSPVDRGRAGSKHHLITDGHGTPLAVVLTGGNRNDVTQLMPLLDAVPPVRGRPGRPRHKPQSVFADRGYDHDTYRDQVRARRILPVIARRGTAHGSGLGAYRWVVERTFAWLHGFKRLRVRWERRADIHEAFFKLACCLITHRQVLSLAGPAN